MSNKNKDISMIDKIIEILKERDNFLIVSHKSPDGDTIGANFALTASLLKLGKDVVSFCDNNLPFEYQFLLDDRIPFITETELILNRKFEVMIMVDCSDSGRLSMFQEFRSNSEILINIDHHRTNDNFGNINLVYPNYSSTGEIVFEILKNGKFYVDKYIATAIYTAILTDTGSFRYSNTNPTTFKVASELLEYGINCWEIAEKVYENKPYKRILLLRDALNSLSLSDNKKVAIMTLHKNIMDKYDATGEDTDGFVNIGRSIAGVEISILIREEKNGCKLSFRSRGNLDVAEIAKRLNGGGHKNAAGAFIEKTADEVESIIKELIKSYGY